MNEKFVGVVTTAKSGKTKTGKDNYSLKIGDKYYSGFGLAPCNDGDTITFDYEDTESGGKIYHNVKYIHNVEKTGVTKETPGELIGESAKKKRAAEMMTCAVNICVARGTISTPEIISQYEEFMKRIGEEIPVVK